VPPGAAPSACTRPGEGDQGVIKISKTILSGADPAHVREQAAGVAPAQLRELAIQLAADPDLTVSVIAYDDGRAELEVLHTGPPHRTEHTIDLGRFTREPAAIPPQAIPVTSRSSFQDAARLVRAILWDAQHSTG
jgi:hypothetical protein